MEYRTTVAAGEGLDFVISDGSLDRHGTRINPRGWSLSSFLKNPIALFGHRSDFPIGKWTDVRVDGDRVVGRLQLAEKGTSQRIDEVISLVEQGVLRAVSVGFSVLKMGTKGRGSYDIDEQELHEVSLVSVPSNVNALAMARAMNISESTIGMVFGEQANGDDGDVNARGEHADQKTAPQMRVREAHQARPQGKRTMSTLAQRIEDAQNDITAKKDRLADLTSAADIDVDAVAELTDQIDIGERSLEALKAAEAKIGVRSTPAGQQVAAPAIARAPLGFAQKQVNGFDLIVRAALVRGVSHFTGKPVERVLDERYPGHEATAIMARADQTIGTTTVSGWAAELVQTSYADFLNALTGVSIYPQLRARGIGLSFDGVGTVSIPSRTAGGASGSFVAEGEPIRVGRITTAATTMTAKKMGVIVPFSRELAKRSTPSIEAVVRQAILEDTAATLDAAMLDATAASTARPAGLLNGVSAVGAGYGGGDYKAVIEDFTALLSPFISANASDSITVIMNPAQGLRLALMEGPLGNPGWFSAISNRVNIVESTYATAGRLIAIRNSDFATALGDAPEFDISEQATVHMEDASPLEIVSGTGPTTADPVRSFFQTATMGVRMIMDVSWKMRRSGMVQWINGTSW